MGRMIEEKHELTLAFNSSEELWQFAKEHQDKVVNVVDYNVGPGIDRWGIFKKEKTNERETQETT